MSSISLVSPSLHPKLYTDRLKTIVNDFEKMTKRTADVFEEMLKSIQYWEHMKIACETNTFHTSTNKIARCDETWEWSHEQGNKYLTFRGYRKDLVNLIDRINKEVLNFNITAGINAEGVSKELAPAGFDDKKIQDLFQSKEKAKNLLEQVGERLQTILNITNAKRKLAAKALDNTLWALKYPEDVNVTLAWAAYSMLWQKPYLDALIGKIQRMILFEEMSKNALESMIKNSNRLSVPDEETEAVEPIADTPEIGPINPEEEIKKIAELIKQLERLLERNTPETLFPQEFPQEPRGLFSWAHIPGLF